MKIIVEVEYEVSPEDEEVFSRVVPDEVVADWVVEENELFRFDERGDRAADDDGDPLIARVRDVVVRWGGPIYGSAPPCGPAPTDGSVDGSL